MNTAKLFLRATFFRWQGHRHKNYKAISWRGAESSSEAIVSSGRKIYSWKIAT